MVNKWVLETFCGRLRKPGGQLSPKHSLPMGETKAPIQGSPLLKTLMHFHSNPRVYFLIHFLVEIIGWNGAVEYPLFPFLLQDTLGVMGIFHFKEAWSGRHSSDGRRMTTDGLE